MRYITALNERIKDERREYSYAQYEEMKFDSHNLLQKAVPELYLQVTRHTALHHTLRTQI